MTYKTSPPVIVTQAFEATADSVWATITDRNRMIRWFFGEIPDFKPLIGFETVFDVENNGLIYPHRWKITECVPNRKITYSWKYDGYPGESFVVWELSSQAPLTILTLTHYGMESFPQDNPDFSRESCLAGWNYFIHERLRAYLVPEP